MNLSVTVPLILVAYLSPSPTEVFQHTIKHYLFQLSFPTFTAKLQMLLDISQSI